MKYLSYIDFKGFWKFSSSLRRVVLLAIILNLCLNLYSQSSSPYYTNDNYEKYIDYLVNKGELKIDHRLSQPYKASELYNGIKEISNTSNNLFEFVKADLDWYFNYSNNAYLFTGIEMGGKLLANEYDLFKRSKGSAFLGLNYQNISFYHQYTADEDYLHDSLYFGTEGKLQNEVFSRSSESYIEFNNGLISLFAGRMNRNYGISGEKSLILSYNAYSLDHIGFEIMHKKFHFVTLFTRLEDYYGYDNRLDSIPDYKWFKRFLSFHRLEVLVNKKLEIALTETMLYGGETQQPLFQYINPSNIYFFAKMSDRKGYEEGSANAQMCIEFLYKPVNKINFFTQFLLDDMDFTKSLRAVYPDRIGLLSKIIYSDPIPSSQLFLRYVRISNWTYNSFYTWGNYTYYGKSLGFPENGLENLSIGFD